MNATESDINLLDSDLLKTQYYFEKSGKDAVRLGLKFMRSTLDRIMKEKTPPLTLEGFTNEQLVNEVRKRMNK